MYCPKCGKLVPDGAKFCSFCGESVFDPAPRHARTDDEEIYSYSDQHISDDMDSTRVFDPEQNDMDATKVYDFAAFEDRDPNFRDDRDGYDPNYDPRYDPRYDPNYDPNYSPQNQDPSTIGDSYENYQDGEDDRTFMDKVDDRFRRDDDDDNRPPRQKKSKKGLWITLGIIAVVLIIVLAVLAFSGKLFGNNKAKPTTVPKATVVATAKPTQPKATQAPAPTQAPETQAPATQTPAPTQAPQPITQAPQPTSPPPTQAPDPTTPPATEAPDPTFAE